MTAIKVDAYQSTPEFKDAMSRFQAGEWEVGLSILEGLMVSYPHSKELRAFFEEMQLRSQIDVYEREDLRRSRRRKVRNMLTSFVLLGVVSILIVWVGIVYSDLIIDQFALASQTIEHQADAVELRWIHENAQVYMRAGMTNEARVLFEQVQERDIDGVYDVEPYLEEIQIREGMNQEYETARALIGESRHREALAILDNLRLQGYPAGELDLMIEESTRQLMFSNMVEQADEAYRAGSWEVAINRYLEIRGSDPDYRQDYIKRQLFNSYVNGGEALIAKPEGNLDDLLKAEEYFRKASTLFPQDKEVMSRLSEIKLSGEDRLFWSFVDSARQSLIDRSDSLEALREAESYFNKALAIKPAEEQIKVEWEMARRYLSAQDAFVRGNWNTVIDDMEFILSQDKDYANGTARQTLYEAYLARADSQMASGQHELAIADYQTAAVLAHQDPGALYRLYEIQLRLATAEDIIGNHENSVRLYRSAAELSGFRSRAAAEKPALAQKIDDADYYASQGNYILASRYYREALAGFEQVYETRTHMVIEGEYLTMIAARYGSSVSAIVEANNIANPNRIFAGQELTVPILRAR
jgi:tetratricopeptide (TPR) repeat protein